MYQSINTGSIYIIQALIHTSYNPINSKTLQKNRIAVTAIQIFNCCPTRNYEYETNISQSQQSNS